jgi:predicted Ser/Thr protein kinase
MYGSFSEKAQEIWDFVRCMRPDGSYYGTAGTCKKGSLAPPSDSRVSGKYLGGGKEGKVYDIDRSRVLKSGRYEEEGAQAHAIAARAGLAPRLYAAGITKSGKGFQVMERVAASDIEGLPHPGTKNSKGKEIEELDSGQLFKEREAYKASLTLNRSGVSHEDLHGGNLKWDDAKGKPVIMDFDNAVINNKAARAEASSTLSSIGIRLENSGYYDEADKFYRMGAKLGKATDKTGDALLSKAVELLDSEFPQ